MLAGGLAADDTGRINYRRRTNDVGPRIYTQDTDTWRLSGGLAGTLDVHTGMNWNVDYRGCAARHSSLPCHQIYSIIIGCNRWIHTSSLLDLFLHE